MFGIFFPLIGAWLLKNTFVQRGGNGAPLPRAPEYVPPPPPPPPYMGPRGGATPPPYAPPPPPPPVPFAVPRQPTAAYPGSQGGQRTAPPPQQMMPLPGPVVAPQAIPGPPPGPAAPVQQLDLANDLAARLVASLRSAGFGYDRNLCTQFQIASGLGADGKYGGRTAGALVYFTGQQPPTPLYEPKNVIPYLPPGSKKVAAPQLTPIQPDIPAPPLDQLDMAAREAVKVAADIRAKGAQYDRNLLKRFQVLARLGADGLYGGSSAGAIAYFTAQPPPAPIFPPKVIKPYRPPGT